MEHIRYSQLGCHCFKKLFVNLSRTVEDLVLIFYNSIQDFFDYETIHNFTYPKHVFCNAKASHRLYYSTEYDSDYDDENVFNELAESVQHDRIDFLKL